jgi:hypothetical protein
MNRIILGDNQAIFRAGAARLLVMEHDMRIIAQCDDAVRLVTAVEATRGATILLSTGLRVELPMLLEQAKALGSRVILITERGGAVGGAFRAAGRRDLARDLGAAADRHDSSGGTRAALRALRQCDRDEGAG